jgi:hypothetical protein
MVQLGLSEVDQIYPEECRVEVNPWRIVDIDAPSSLICFHGNEFFPYGLVWVLRIM